MREHLLMALGMASLASSTQQSSFNKEDYIMDDYDKQRLINARAKLKAKAQAKTKKHLKKKLK